MLCVMADATEILEHEMTNAAEVLQPVIKNFGAYDVL